MLSASELGGRALFERQKRQLLYHMPKVGSAAWKRLTAGERQDYSVVLNKAWETLEQRDRDEFIEQSQVVLDAIGIP